MKGVNERKGQGQTFILEFEIFLFQLKNAVFELAPNRLESGDLVLDFANLA
jgi:hypothetical protein